MDKTIYPLEFNSHMKFKIYEFSYINSEKSTPI